MGMLGNSVIITPLLLDVVGCCWMLLDAVGHCWTLLDAAGCCARRLPHQPGCRCAVHCASLCVTGCASLCVTVHLMR